MDHRDYEAYHKQKEHRIRNWFAPRNVAELFVYYWMLVFTFCSALFLVSEWLIEIFS